MRDQDADPDTRTEARGWFGNEEGRDAPERTHSERLVAVIREVGTAARQPSDHSRIDLTHFASLWYSPRNKSGDPAKRALTFPCRAARSPAVMIKIPGRNRTRGTKNSLPLSDGWETSRRCDGNR